MLCFIQYSLDAKSTKAAPSLIPEELPAVTVPVPSFKNEGLRVASFSLVQFLFGNSSVSNWYSFPL